MSGTRLGSLVVYRRLLRQARPHWLRIAGLFILSLLSTPLSLLLPLPLKIAVDSVVGTQPLPPLLEPLVPAAVRSSSPLLLAFVAGLAVGIASLIYLQSLTVWVLTTYTGEKLILNSGPCSFATSSAFRWPTMTAGGWRTPRTGFSLTLPPFNRSRCRV